MLGGDRPTTEDLSDLSERVGDSAFIENDPLGMTPELTAAR